MIKKLYFVYSTWNCNRLMIKKTKNWWVSQILPDKSRIEVGYWPKELFNLLGDDADMVGFGGIVISDPKGPSPPMGNGHLPNEHTHAYVIRMNVIDSNYTTIGANLTTLDPLLDSKKYYGVRYIGYVDEEVGVAGPVAMSYGGPGGDSCGD
ncbi:hypothetical protein EUTSA_v10028179mg [Eutrema salsugineum]|uniref:Neprosin PEP catalytic domain-containing protein n=1 Tax=Eutrema salsugineum TaxID=72664 RepID=V4LAI0_EUTSA|nr:hypothetical protein EUTSA_v10028179mg [Eutrema salsugineum]